MAYGDFKFLPRRRASDKVLREKAFNIAKNPKYHGYQVGFASLVYIFSDKKFSGSGFKSEIMPNQQLVKPLIRKFKKRKVHPSFKDIIWGADLK